MQDDNLDAKFPAIEKIMTAEGLPPVAIATFKYYYKQLLNGISGQIAEADIAPVETLPDVTQFDGTLRDAGREAVPATVAIRLNGGLGTSMGLSRAKSLIEVKDGLSFLDIIARQAVSSGTPLLLMNSFATREDSLAALRQYPELDQFGIPADFIQHKVPKISSADLQPVRYPRAPQLEWCPPGHGDIYTALMTSGVLKALLTAGYRYAFIANADNLGACLDESILGYLVTHSCPFLMEVADRTAADSKGGHLARRPDGQLILRESAQCPADDRPAFQDISRHKYFNTNNLWLDLRALQEIMAERNDILGLPMICNAKTVDPANEDSARVYQLETAMGSAIAVIDGARAVRVPRTRFAPVKTTNDLLLVRSDAYALTDSYQLLPVNPAGTDPGIDLDDRYYRVLDDFSARFAAGIPSLASCRQLTVIGDVKFGANIKLQGVVRIDNQSGKQVLLEQNSIIQGELTVKREELRVKS